MRISVILTALALGIGLSGGAEASIIPLGSALTFGGDNLPGACANTTCSDNTTFGGTVSIDGGALSLTTSQVADGPNAEWDVWSITNPTGGPVAGNTSGDWALIMSYALSADAYFDAVVNQWTVGGAPVSPLTNFGGICCATATNPSPITGEAYYNSGFSSPIAAGTVNSWQQIFSNPYSYISSGGIDPATADGFSFALHFTRQTPLAPVPEPASLALLGVALAGLGAARRRR